ncbi:MAG: hypothetical protein HRU09_08210 [Oligoflexales bacterium]|nr:hypothetical protein [Oligoflexales bacterium]
MKLTFPPNLFVGFMILMLAEYSFGVGKESKEFNKIPKNIYMNHLSLKLDQASADEWSSTLSFDHDAQLIAKKKKRRKKRRRKPGGGASASASSVSPILYLLPLGIGQFANGSAVLGSLFGLAQVGGLGFMFVNWTAANTKIEETNTYIDERNAQFDALTNDTDRIAHQNETDQNVQIFDEEAEAMIQSANIGLIVFVVAYAGSIIEAFVSGPSEEPGAGGGRKKRRKRRRRSSTDGLPKDKIIEEQAYEPVRPVSPSWDLELSPAFSRYDDRILRPEFALKWELKF